MNAVASGELGLLSLDVLLGQGPLFEVNHRPPGRALTEVNEGNEEPVGTSFPSLPSVTSGGD